MKSPLKENTRTFQTVSKMPNPFIDVINRSIGEPHAGLLAGMLFGVKSTIPSDLYEALISTGTIHIVALSGQNISILMGIVASSSLVFGRKASALFTIFAIGLFLIIVEMEPSLIRAVIMGSMQIIALYFGRLYWSVLSLILAGCTMLLVNPAWIDDVSFQLSFLATLGIILIGPKGVSLRQDSDKKTQFIHELKSNLQITLAAQIFTLPVVAWHFRRLSLIAPVTNLLISWTIAPIMVMGLILSGLGFVSDAIGHLVGLITWPLLEYLVRVVELTAKIPYASITF